MDGRQLEAVSGIWCLVAGIWGLVMETRSQLANTGVPIIQLLAYICWWSGSW